MRSTDMSAFMVTLPRKGLPCTVVAAMVSMSEFLAVYTLVSLSGPLDLREGAAM